MMDYEGSRAEFLKLLVEMGEEPAFIGRAMAPRHALERLLESCEMQREEMLKWPRYHFSILHHRISGNWARLQTYLNCKDAKALFDDLARQIAVMNAARSPLIATERTLLRRFVDSGRRFNDAWRRYLAGTGLDTVNQLRDEYNRFYPLEKACAFGIEIPGGTFEPLPMLGHDYLAERFPLLSLPDLR